MVPATIVRLLVAYVKDAEGTVMLLFLTLQRNVAGAMVPVTIVQLLVAYAKDAEDADGF